jgi:hypothetical protein
MVPVEGEIKYCCGIKQTKYIKPRVFKTKKREYIGDMRSLRKRIYPSTSPLP